MDLVKHHQREDFTDTRHRPQQHQTVLVTFPGMLENEPLDLLEFSVVDIDQGQIEFHAPGDAGIVEALGDAGPIALVAEIEPDLGQIVLAVGVMDVGQQLGTLAHQVHAAPEQIAGRSHRSGIDIGHRKHPAAKQHGDLLGIDAVVFGFAAVDGPHVEGVTEDEMNAFVTTQVSQPVPGEHALDRDNEVIPIRFDCPQERRRSCFGIAMEQDFAVMAENAQVDGAGMQIDAAVVGVRLGVESHLRSPPSYVMWRHTRHSTMDGSLACQARKSREEASISINAFNSDAGKAGAG